MNADVSAQLEKKLDMVIELLRQIVALELNKCGLKQSDIAKRLHVATKGVNEMLKGIKKER